MGVKRLGEPALHLHIIIGAQRILPCLRSVYVILEHLALAARLSVHQPSQRKHQCVAIPDDARLQGAAQRGVGNHRHEDGRHAAREEECERDVERLEWALAEGFEHE